MAQVVVHARKIKTLAGLRNVAAHNAREGVYAADGTLTEPAPEWIKHPERAQYNRGDLIPPEATLKRWRDRIAAANLIRKPQKNAAVGIEFVVTAAEGARPGINEWRDYLKDAEAFLKRRYGAANVVQVVRHYDETTPHMHLIMTPILERDGKARFSSSDFLGGREGLRSLQTDFAREVGAKHSLERGTEGSKARHTDQHNYPSKVRKELRELDRKTVHLEATLTKNGEILQRLVEERKTLEAVQQKLGPVASRTLGQMLTGVPAERVNECWGAFATKAEEIRVETREAGCRATQTPKNDRSHGKGR
jgi:hypothetical protein